MLSAHDGPLSAGEVVVVRAAVEGGHLIAFPTDTVYGVGADAGNPEAIARLFAAKQRPPTKPLPVLVADVAGLHQCCPAPPEAALALAREFWPGPLTLIVPRSPLICPEAVAGGDTVGLRMPDHPAALALLRALRGPLAVTSANLSGEESTTSPAEVYQTLGPRLAVLIDALAFGSGLPSTVIDLTLAPPRILRLGAITPEQLASVIGDVTGP